MSYRQTNYGKGHATRKASPEGKKNTEEFWAKREAKEIAKAWWLYFQENGSSKAQCWKDVPYTTQQVFLTKARAVL